MEAFGRADEVKRVADAVAAGRSIAVVGEPGIGKSLVAAAAVPGALAGQAVSLLSTEPWFALDRAVGALPRSGGPEAVASRVVAALDGRALLIDDLQWVDPATLQVLQFLPTVVATARPEARALAEGLGWDIVELGPLADDDAAALARSVSPDADVDAVVAFALGNPLALVTAARDGIDDIATVVRRRLETLSDHGRAAAIRAAIATGPIDADDELEALGLQTPHALIAEAVLVASPDDAVRDAHAWWAARSERPSAKARHLIAAGREAQARECVAAEPAEPEERAECLLIASTLSPDDAVLRHRAGWALYEVRRFDDAVPLLRRFEVPTEFDEMVATMRQTLDALEGAGDLVGLQSVIDAVPAAPLLQHASHDAQVLGVRLRIAASNVAIKTSADRSVAMAAAEEAWAAARQTGIEVAHAGRTLGLILGEECRAGWREVLEEALDAAQEAEERLTILNVIAALAPRNGEFELAAVTAARLADEAREAGHVVWMKVAAFHGASLALREGRLEDVEAPLAAVRDVPGPQLLQIQLECLAAEARAFRGEDVADELRAVIASGPADNPMVSELHASVGWAELWSGDIERARQAGAASSSSAVTTPELDGAAVLRAWVAFESATASEPPSSVSDLLLAREVAALHACDAAALRRLSEEWRASDATAALRTAYAAARAENDSEAFRSVLAVADAMGAGAIARRCRTALRKLRAPGFGGTDAPGRTGLLTGREIEVLTLVGEGLTDAAIAQRLSLSRSTVSSTIRRAAGKLGVAGRARAAAAMLRP